VQEAVWKAIKANAQAHVSGLPDWLIICINNFLAEEKTIRYWGEYTPQIQKETTPHAAWQKGDIESPNSRSGKSERHCRQKAQKGQDFRNEVEKTEKTYTWRDWERKGEGKGEEIPEQMKMCHKNMTF